jgi:FtsH-binding integral membrane protein
MSRAAGVAALACDGLLIAAFAAWGWSQAFPQRALPPQVASVVVVLSLASGAVGLIAARRSNRIGVFLFTLLAVLAGAWLWSRLQTDLGPVVPRTLLVR